jgi:hypothetical protein
MANPVNNGGISAKVSVGDLLDVDLQIGGTAKVSEDQSKGIFGNVNENFTRNPNHRGTGGHAEASNQQPDARAGESTAPPAFARDGNDESTAPPARKNGNQTTIGNPGEDGTVLNGPRRGENGETRGPQKGGNQGQTQTQETPPIVILPTEERGGNPKTGQTENTPPIIFMPTEGGDGKHDNGNHYGRNHKNFPIFTTPNTNWQTNLPTMGVNFSIEANLRANGNQPYGIIRTVVNQVLQQNDIYLSHNTINRLINNQTFQNSTRNSSQSPLNLPREVSNLLQNIGHNVLSLLDNAQQNRKLIHQISKEISHQLRDNIQTAKHSILKNADLGAAHFKHLNIKERMHVAVELLPRHVPAKALEHLQNHKTHDVLNGLLLARGLIVPGENSAEIRNLAAFKSSVLPSEFSLTTMRDVGQLVKILISDTAAAKTTANLDLAVQKFVKILLANNELGVLLATVNLAAQSPNQSGLVGRSLALAQIYELIAQLIQAGEKAMKEAGSEKNILQKDRNIFQPVGLSAVDEFDESKTLLNKLQSGEAAGSLRQFLEFNPAFVFDNSASAFNNQEDARQAQKDFINLNHNDIEQWLKSGNHRFVKDYDFDKPVGVVVERSSEGVFTANTARFVLVRDGSVQGWHFLKSFLVK